MERKCFTGFALLTLLLLVDAKQHNGNDAQVIIVGAGLAGIMAAKSFQEHGMNDFLILEATNAIGGRMREHPFGVKKIELGATWVVAVNETTTNPIWNLAQKHHLQSSKTDFDNINMYTKRGLVNTSTMQDLFKQQGKEEEYLANLGLRMNAAKTPDMSVLAAQRMYGKVPTRPEEMALDYFAYDYEYAEPTNVISFKHTHPNPIYRDFGNGLQLVYDQRGFSYLAWKLAEEFLATKNNTITDSRLKLNTVVNNIIYTPDGVTMKTEKGKIYRSKYIVVTVSLGVLQSGLIKFNPPLPEWKRVAINKLDMCHFTKIFLKFPYKFWPDKLTEFFLYAERKGYYTIWQHMEKEFPGEHIMLTTVTDIESRRIEQQAVAETKKEIVAVLKNMFGNKVPEPVAILVPKWGKNRYFAGSNSNWPVDLEDYEFKRIGAHIHTLHFAGEHTNPLYRALQGAYYSGIEVANHVLRCMSTGKACETSIPHAENVVTGIVNQERTTYSMTNEMSTELVDEWRIKQVL